MRHDHVGDEGRELLHDRAGVLVDVDDEVRRAQLADLGDVDGLRAAHLGHAPDGALRMDAEAGASDELVFQAEAEQEFGDAGDEADDAHDTGGGFVRLAEGVGQFVLGVRNVGHGKASVYQGPLTLPAFADDRKRGPGLVAWPRGPAPAVVVSASGRIDRPTRSAPGRPGFGYQDEAGF